jgi:hypothetical protein
MISEINLTPEQITSEVKSRYEKILQGTKGETTKYVSELIAFLDSLETKEDKRLMEQKRDINLLVEHIEKKMTQEIIEEEKKESSEPGILLINYYEEFKRPDSKWKVELDELYHDGRAFIDDAKKLKGGIAQWCEKQSSEVAEILLQDMKILRGNLTLLHRMIIVLIYETWNMTKKEQKLFYCIKKDISYANHELYEYIREKDLIQLFFPDHEKVRPEGVCKDHDAELTELKNKKDHVHVDFKEQKTSPPYNGMTKDALKDWKNMCKSKGRPKDKHLAEWYRKHCKTFAPHMLEKMIPNLIIKFREACGEDVSNYIPKYTPIEIKLH